MTDERDDLGCAPSLHRRAVGNLTTVMDEDVGAPRLQRRIRAVLDCCKLLGSRGGVDAESAIRALWPPVEDADRESLATVTGTVLGLLIYLVGVVLVIVGAMAMGDGSVVIPAAWLCSSSPLL